jgi:glutathione reductase (NADPH)
VIVDEYLQSVSNPSVYAAGDAAASGPPLTPVADHDSDVVATNLLEGNRRKVSYDGLASAVFTSPPLASVGLTEATARAKGLRFRAHREDTSGWLSSQRVGATVSGSKVLVEEGSGRILGAHLLGPHADEVINVFAVAVRFGIRVDDLRQLLFAYPTNSSDIPYML